MLATMFLISIISSFFIAAIYGILCDRMKVWKLLLLNSIIILVGNTIFVFETLQIKETMTAGDKGLISQDIGFIMIITFTTN